MEENIFRKCNAVGLNRYLLQLQKKDIEENPITRTVIDWIGGLGPVLIQFGVLSVQSTDDVATPGLVNYKRVNACFTVKRSIAQLLRICFDLMRNSHDLFHSIIEYRTSKRIHRVSKILTKRSFVINSVQ